MVERGSGNVTDEGTVLGTISVLPVTGLEEFSKQAANALWFLFPLW